MNRKHTQPHTHTHKHTHTSTHTMPPRPLHSHTTALHCRTSVLPLRGGLDDREDAHSRKRCGEPLAPPEYACMHVRIYTCRRVCPGRLHTCICIYVFIYTHTHMIYSEKHTYDILRKDRRTDGQSRQRHGHVRKEENRAESICGLLSASSGMHAAFGAHECMAWCISTGYIRTHVRTYA